MTHQNKQAMVLALVIFFFNCSAPLYSCMTTVHNDSARPILIIDHNDAHTESGTQAPVTILSIQKNTSRRFGKAHEHAFFTVYTKQAKNPSFVATYEVQQNECGDKGNPFLKLSDLENNTGNARLFTITKREKQYSSMVRQLPSLQRPDIFKEEREEPTEPRSCSACMRGKQ